MFKWFKKSPSHATPQDLEGRSFIVHTGFPEDWLKELLKQPGGGSYFRLDLRLQDGQTATPVENFIHQCLQALKLEPPVFITIKDGRVYVRSLLAGSYWLLPSDMGPLNNEIEQRFHFKLENDEWRPGMPLEQNDIDYEAMLSDVTQYPEH